MLSGQLKQYTEAAWQAALPGMGGLTEGLKNNLAQVSGDEAVLLKLLYATLPISDIASVPTDILMRYVRHGLFLREHSPYCRDIPEDYFLHFVFYPRINSEDLTDCRTFFHDLISHRLTGLSETDAALEVNRWCCENMTYQSTNDRTESPIAAYRTGLGRCGEESTFAVTAYRSVGIPARQIYVPYWVHCDDNHAWVEVYVNGRWAFLGACEPEPVLNRGWFTDASSRAPIECYRTFFDYIGEGMEEEQLFETRGSSSYYNVTHHYAEICDLTLTVQSEAGVPVPGAKVHLDVVNMAALRTVMNGITDQRGQVRIQVGRFTAHVEAYKDGLFAMEELAITGDACECILTLTPRVPLSGTTELDCIPPSTTSKNRTVLTEGQQIENAKTLANCALLRNQRIQGYYQAEYDQLDSQWQEMLHLAGGNAPELFHFYGSRKPGQRELAKRMLQSIATKDYRDITCDILQGHWKFALRYSNAEHFVEEVLNPRIRHEMIENWRPVLEGAFTEEEKAAFAADPQSFMDYIYASFPDGQAKYYPLLSMQPSAVFAAGLSDEKGRRLLFVAGMRTFGVPARINPADESAEYWRDGSYHCVSHQTVQARCCTIQLIPQENVRFVYANNYTLARWDEAASRYVTLNYANDTGENLEDPFCIPVTSGEYRLLTASRLPNGSQLCRMTHFTLQDGERVELPLTLRQASPEEMLSNSKLERFSLKTAEGTDLSSDKLLSGRTVLIYLDVSKEPTEHILNEIVGARDAMTDAMEHGLKLVYILRNQGDLSDPTLNKALAAVPGAELYFDDFQATATMLARKMFLETGVWPLLVLTDSGHRGYYGTCGYQVGTAELTLNLNQCIARLGQ